MPQLDLQPHGLLARLGSWLPGRMAQQLNALEAVQRLLVSLSDDAAAYLAALVLHALLPPLLALVGEALASSATPPGACGV